MVCALLSDLGAAKVLVLGLGGADAVDTGQQHRAPDVRQLDLEPALAGLDAVAGHHTFDPVAGLASGLVFDNQGYDLTRPELGAVGHPHSGQRPTPLLGRAGRALGHPFGQAW